MSEAKRRRVVVEVEAVASGFTLEHPALTPMPAELRPATHSGESHSDSVRGTVAVKRGRSARGYDTGAPWATRVIARGDYMAERQHLEAVRDLVAAGWSLLEAVADGTLWGWRMRLDLSNVVGDALANWDRRPGRTQAERLAAVDRALGELSEQAPHGGWFVTSEG